MVVCQRHHLAYSTTLLARRISGSGRWKANAVQSSPPIYDVFILVRHGTPLDWLLCYNIGQPSGDLLGALSSILESVEIPSLS